MHVDRLSISARPPGLPLMRQWWGKLLFMHWPVPVEHVRRIVPKPLSIDIYEGRAWIGVVPFRMWGVRQSLLPPIPGASSFLELNVRTYVHYDGVPGVWFFSMDIDSALATWGGRVFYHLPYHVARMSLRQRGARISHSSVRSDPQDPAAFEATWETGDPLEQSPPGSLTFFLTERYCLYSKNGDELYRCRIHHQPWPLRGARLHSYRSTLLESLGVPTPEGEPLLHYAEAIKTDIWPLRRVSKRASGRHVFENMDVLEAKGVPLPNS